MEMLHLVSVGFDSVSIGSFRLTAWSSKPSLGSDLCWTLMLHEFVKAIFQLVLYLFWRGQKFPMSDVENTIWNTVKIPVKRLLHPLSLLDDSLTEAAALSLKKYIFQPWVVQKLQITEVDKKCLAVIGYCVWNSVQIIPVKPSLKREWVERNCKCSKKVKNVL